MVRYSAMEKVVALACLSFISQALAKDAVTTIPLYGYDMMAGLDGSVIAVKDHVTTMSLQCLPGTDSDNCGLGPQQTLTIGPSTYNMYIGEGKAFTGTQQCIRHGSTEAVCHESYGGPQANSPGSSTVTYSGSEVDYMAVTITAGANKLNGGAGTVTGVISTAASTGKSVSTGAAITSPPAATAATGVTASSSSTSSAAESATATQSKNAAPSLQSGRASLMAAFASFLGMLFA